jgi:hypothetical protein
MPSFFPRSTIELHQPGAFRRFSFSLAEMAVITGLLVRLYRLFVVTHTSSWVYVLGMAIGMLFLLAMTTLHLANYPLHQYLWRAPVFALVEVMAEMAASALLIWLGREPNGSVRAHWDDWAGMGLNTLLWRGPDHRAVGTRARRDRADRSAHDRRGRRSGARAAWRGAGEGLTGAFPEA